MIDIDRAELKLLIREVLKEIEDGLKEIEDGKNSIHINREARIALYEKEWLYGKHLPGVWGGAEIDKRASQLKDRTKFYYYNGLYNMSMPNGMTQLMCTPNRVYYAELLVDLDDEIERQNKE